MTVHNKLLFPVTAGANVFCIRHAVSTVGITVNSPPDPTWEAGSPVSFDVDFDAAGYGFINWDNTLEAWWRFENEGATIQDWSGNRNLLVRSASGTYVAGAKGGYAMDVSGTGAYKAMGKHGHCGLFLPRDTGATISLWVKYTANAAHNYFIELAGKGSNLGLYGHNLGTDIVCAITDRRSGGNAEFIITSITPGDNAWHHLCAVLNFTTGTLTPYWDSVAKTPVVIPLDDGAISGAYYGTVTIGSTQSDTMVMAGAIDEVLIFSRSLTAAEVTALYAIAAGNLTTTFAVVDGETHTYEIVHVGATGLVAKTAKASLLIDTA